MEFLLRNAMLAIILLFVPVQGWAFSHEPIGFNDLYMGEKLRFIGQRYVLEHSKADSGKPYEEYFVFSAPNVHTTYLGVPLMENVPLVARFHRGKLGFLDLSFWGESMLERLHDAMVKEYGAPNYYNGGTWYWIGNQICLLLVNNDMQSGYVGRDSYCSVRFVDKSFLRAIT